MKLLNEVKIMGKTFKVEYLDFDKALQGSRMDGSSNKVKQSIQVDSTAHREYQESTLLHEILHMISYDLNLNLDETVVCQLETSLYQVFKDNGLFASDETLKEQISNMTREDYEKNKQKESKKQ